MPLPVSGDCGAMTVVVPRGEVKKYADSGTWSCHAGASMSVSLQKAMADALLRSLSGTTTILAVSSESPDRAPLRISNSQSSAAQPKSDVRDPLPVEPSVTVPSCRISAKTPRPL